VATLSNALFSGYFRLDCGFQTRVTKVSDDVEPGSDGLWAMGCRYRPSGNPTGAVAFPLRGVAKATSSKYTPPSLQGADEIAPCGHAKIFSIR
jgi:hypothetical protein